MSVCIYVKINVSTYEMNCLSHDENSSSALQFGEGEIEINLGTRRVLSLLHLFLLGSQPSPQQSSHTALTIQDLAGCRPCYSGPDRESFQLLIAKRRTAFLSQSNPQQKQGFSLQKKAQKRERLEETLILRTLQAVRVQRVHPLLKQWPRRIINQK